MSMYSAAREISHTQPEASETDALYCFEAEQQLIGCIMIDNRAFHRVSDIIGVEQFSDPTHAAIWEICATRIAADALVSPVVLKTLMANHKGLSDLGGAPYIVRLAGVASSPLVAREMARIVVETWQRRTVYFAFQKAMNGITSGAPVSEAMNALLAVSDALSVSNGQPVSISYMRAVVDAMESAAQAHHGKSIGINLGLAELDKLLGPLRGGDFIVLGGAPSMGKTSLALSIANRAADAGMGVAICSLEMTGQSLAFRAISEKASVPYSDIIRGKVSEDDFRRVAEGASAIKDREIQIIQPHVKDLHSLNAALARIKRQMEGRGKKLGLVLVDYLQLVRATGKSRYEIVSNVSTGLKAMAMQFDVPLIALSQLSRDVQSRDDHRPRLSDLRESGQIEQDADFVLFAHRDYYYLLREGPKQNPSERGNAKDQAASMLADHDAALGASRNKLDVICAKLRMGEVGTVTLGFDEKTNEIWSIGSDRRQEGMF